MPAPRWLYVGRITAPFGVHGEVRATLDTEFPERLPERPVFIGDERRPLTVEVIHPHRREALLKLRGVDTVEAADALRDQPLFVAAEDSAPLPEGRYYVHQIIGLEVRTAAGERYGVVKDVLLRPANDVYVIQHGNRQVLAPAIADVVKAIDLAAGTITIVVLPGMEE